MTGDEVRQVCEAMWPQEAIARLCQPCGVIERQRQLHLGLFVRAMVISAGTPGGAYPADVLRSSLECEVPQVARSACYRWFDEPLEPCMAALAARALADARAPQVDRSGPRCGGPDWSLVEATTVRGRDARREACPGTGDDAALTVHKVLSVGCGAPVRGHFSPAREHDRRHLQLDESWRGDGRLADRASARLDRLRACDTHGVRFVMRLTAHWQPTVDDLARGQVTPACFPGTDLATLLEDATLVLDGRAIDADVPSGRGSHALGLRLVGVQTPKGDGFFRTHRPPPDRPAAGRRPLPRAVGGGTPPPAGPVGQPPGGQRRRAAVHPEDPLAGLAPRLDHRRPPRAYPPRENPPAAAWRATHRGPPARPAPGVAARRLRSVHRPGRRAAGGRGHATLAHDGSVAHASRKRPPLAPSTIRPRSAPRLETPAPCVQRGQQR